MIIARSPLRISLGGGGTDLPSYSDLYEGYVLSAAINKYVYVTVMHPFNEGVYLKYSQIENVGKISAVKHPIIREALQLLGLKTPQIEITTLADIPAGTGLGSSSSFATALLKALFHHYHKPLSAKETAEIACDIEINRLKEPIGKQDQYIAAFGGITAFDFHKDGSTDVTPLPLPIDTIFDLEDNLLLFFTGFSRKASDILKDQESKTKDTDQDMIANLRYVKEMGYRITEALKSGKCNLFGEIMHEHWLNKKKRSKGMSNPQIDEWYELAMNNGAIGGKLVGAGGGGFLMFYTEERNKLRHAMQRAGLQEVRFKFDFEGAKIVSC